VGCGPVTSLFFLLFAASRRQKLRAAPLSLRSLAWRRSVQPANENSGGSERFRSEKICSVAI
jgi:hypothetical protein